MCVECRRTQHRKEAAVVRELRRKIHTPFVHDATVEHFFSAQAARDRFSKLSYAQTSVLFDKNRGEWRMARKFGPSQSVQQICGYVQTCPGITSKILREQITNAKKARAMESVPTVDDGEKTEQDILGEFLDTFDVPGSSASVMRICDSKSAEALKLPMVAELGTARVKPRSSHSVHRCGCSVRSRRGRRGL